MPKFEKKHTKRQEKLLNDMHIFHNDALRDGAGVHSLDRTPHHKEKDNIQILPHLNNEWTEFGLTGTTIGSKETTNYPRLNKKQQSCALLESIPLDTTAATE